MIAYRPLDRALTDPLESPARPPARCDGKICADDALATIPAYQAVIATCNADRARAALAGATDGQR